MGIRGVCSGCAREQRVSEAASCFRLRRWVRRATECQLRESGCTFGIGERHDAERNSRDARTDDYTGAGQFSGNSYNHASGNGCNGSCTGGRFDVRRSSS
ncbi:MAG TPA: hypothetical protein VH062_12680 [Polyangiaceae bacterium]|nr:hypothetical protein [Polyangiaceae bacterium]